MNFRQFDRFQDLGLLIIRTGIGIVYMVHGFPKMFGGPEQWEVVGEAIRYVGIQFVPVFWGFLASASVFFGGILIILGFFFRPATIFLFCTMLVAMFYHTGIGEDFHTVSHSLKMAILFFALFFTGPGRYSMDDKVLFQVKR